MSLPVYIYDVVDEIDGESDMITAFINRKTGELTILTEDDYYALQMLDDGGAIEDLPPWQQKIIPKLREVDESDDFMPLPSPFDVHEYQIMEDFIRALEDGRVKDELFEAIRGRGAFLRYKDKAFYHNVQGEYWDFEKIPSSASPLTSSIPRASPGRRRNRMRIQNTHNTQFYALPSLHPKTSETDEGPGFSARLRK